MIHSKHAFAAPSDDVARAIVLTEAAKIAKIDDELQPVEVKLRAWA